MREEALLWEGQDLPHLLYCLDKANSLDLRKATREDHLAFLRDSDKVMAAGPLLPLDGDSPVGSLVLVPGENVDTVRSWGSEDPYAKAGLFDSVTVRPTLEVDVTGLYLLDDSLSPSSDPVAAAARKHIRHEFGMEDEEGDDEDEEEEDEEDEAGDETEAEAEDQEDEEDEDEEVDEEPARSSDGDVDVELDEEEMNGPDPLASTLKDEEDDFLDLVSMRGPCYTMRCATALSLPIRPSRRTHAIRTLLKPGQDDQNQAALS